MLGETGVGKSTLAVSFTGTGGRLLSDDLVGVHVTPSGVTAVAAYAGARLWPDVVGPLGHRVRDLQPIAHYTEKRRVPREALSGRARATAPLGRIYVLQRSRREISVTTLRGGEAAMSVLAHVTRIDARDTPAEDRRLDAVARLISLVPAKRLAFPHVTAKLPDVRQAILDDLQKGQA